MLTFTELIERMPATVERYGLREPGDCSRCNAAGTVVLGSKLCEACYCQVIAEGGKSRSRKAKLSTALSAKRLSFLVAIEGAVSIAQLEADEGAQAAGLAIVEAVGKGWLTEDDDDQLRPTGKLPSGKGSAEARAALAERDDRPDTPKDLSGRVRVLVDYVTSQNRAVSRPDAMRATGMSENSLAEVLRQAKSTGALTTRRGPGGGIVVPEPVSTPA